VIFFKNNVSKSTKKEEDNLIVGKFDKNINDSNEEDKK
jgi:hypothetical protein